MKKNNQQFVVRSHIIFAGIVLSGCVLIANLFSIQVTHGDYFRRQADGQYVISSHSIFERGSIFFEEKNGTRSTAAGQQLGFKVSVNPSNFNRNPEDVYEKISTIIELDREVFMNALEKKERVYIEIAHRISEEQGQQIKNLVGNAVQLHPEKWRIYPLKNFAAQTLGFLAYQDNDYAGRYGLERFYENVLARKDVSLYTNVFARIFHNVQGVVDPKNNQEGNIITTLDPHIQIFLEGNIKDIQEKWQAQSVGGIVMNPRTGEIYALGSVPSFDNNVFSEYSLNDFKNPLVENVHEMGSIVKPLIIATALDTGVINADTFSYYDAGTIDVGIHTIKNFDGRGRGQVNVQDILSQSLNTGMVAIGQKISKQDFRDYFLDSFGFGRVTGIDLPNEGRNLTTNLASNRDIEFANISFGQGIAVTPISMVSALSTLANQGKTVTPHLVKKIEYRNGLSKKIDYSKESKQSLSPETAEDISRMLVNVFDAYRSGAVKLPHHSVAAKTGTAQIPHPQGGYYDDRNLHSFFGYFPAYDPEFIVFLYTIHPQGVRYASETLIDPFTDIVKYLINYKDIPPDR